MANRFFGHDNDGTPPGAAERTEPARIVRRLTASQSVPGPRASSRIALLIGNSAYPGGRLRNPGNDVELLARALREVAFDVEVVHDAGKSQLEHAIVAFGARLAEAGSEAIAIFYFAGHGIQSQGQNYLIPIDARIPEARFLRSGALRVDFLLEELAQVRTRANLVILDACRNNPIPVNQQGSETLRGLAAIEAVPDATAIVFSTAAGAEASDGDGVNSPYATALAHALVRPGAKLRDIVFETATTVAQATGGRQRPALFVQGALPDAAFDKPKPPPTPTSKPTVNEGPWGRLGPDLDEHAPAAEDSAWTLPDPVLTIERPIPSGVLRYGLSGQDWEQGIPGALVNEVLSTGRWPEVEAGWVACEPYAATLVAIRNMASMRADWGQPDLELAARAARIGAAAGIRQAFVVIGWLHEVGGGGFPREPRVDRAILAAMAERGYRFAELQYGILLALGVDQPPAPAEAIGWLEKAAAKGLPNALHEIGRLYTDLVRVPYQINPEKARHYLSRAAATGHVGAASALAGLYLDLKIEAGEPSEVLGLLDLAAGAGDADALYRRGMLFEHGDTVARNLGKAMADFTASARAGSTDAMLALMFHAAHGNEIAPRDPRAAAAWCELAASKGSAVGKANLGHFHETGFGVGVSSARAKECFSTAAAAGNLNASIGLARLAIRSTHQADIDPARIKQLLAPALDGPNQVARRQANLMLARLETRARLDEAPGLVQIPDIAIGGADALVNLVVFQSIADAACACFHVEVLSPVRTRFVDQGHVRIALREARVGSTGGVEALVRGAVPSRQWAIVERLLSTQSEWTAQDATPGALANQLGRVLADFGYDEASAWRATSDHHLLSTVMYLSGKIATDFGVREVPTVFVNGCMLVRPDLAMVEAAILLALPPELAFELAGGSTFGLAGG